MIYKLIVVAVLTISSLAASGQPADGRINPGLLQRVVEISPDMKDAAAAFLVEDQNAVYLVSVKHVFEKVKFPSSTSIYVRNATGWDRHEVSAAYSTVGDVAVLTPSDPILKTDVTGIQMCPVTGAFLLQDYIFMGFPYDHIVTFPRSSKLSTFALPFLKRAMASGITPIDGTYNWLILDGINNHGFSGGPLLKRADGELGYCVGGVVSGYWTDPANVTLKGKKVQDQIAVANSGLMVASPPELISATIAVASARRKKPQ